jgi:hypothetical protein
MAPKQQLVSVDEFSNLLPPRYHCWLDLYDEVAAQCPPLEDFSLLQGLDAAEYYFQFQPPRPLAVGVRVAVIYNFTRDYVLARIAEELLKSRLPRKAVGEMRTWLLEGVRDAQNAEASWAYNSASERLRPLFDLAFATAKK